VQGQIWDPLTWNVAGPESPRTVGRRDGGGGWNEYAGTPAYNARRKSRMISLEGGVGGVASRSISAAIESEEGSASLYPEKAKVASVARLSDEAWWEKQEVRD